MSVSSGPTLRRSGRRSCSCGFLDWRWSCWRRAAGQGGAPAAERGRTTLTCSERLPSLGAEEALDGSRSGRQTTSRWGHCKPPDRSQMEPPKPGGARRAATCSSRSDRLPSGGRTGWPARSPRSGAGPGRRGARTSAGPWPGLRCRPTPGTSRTVFASGLSSGGPTGGSERLPCPARVPHRAGREVLGGRPLPRLDLADHVVGDVHQGGQVLLGQVRPGPVEAQLGDNQWISWSPGAPAWHRARRRSHRCARPSPGPGR